MGIALGTAALIISLSILAGFEKEIKDKVVAFVTHIQVHGFNDEPIPYTESKLSAIQSEVQGIQSISPYVARQGMIRSKSAVDGIYIKGIDPEREHTLLERYIVSGKFLTQGDNSNKELVLGKKLATKLNVGIGDSVVVFGISRQDAQITPRVMKLAVTGIYESGMAEYDDIYAFTRLENAQRLFDLQGKISGYDVMVKNTESTEQITENLNQHLGFPHIARSMYHLYRNLFSWIELQKRLSPVLLFLIIIVATINILGTLLMFVVEKVKAIGVLTTLGATSRNLQNIFFYQGVIISLIGIGLGNILGWAICFIQKEFNILSLPSDIYFMNSVPIELSLTNFLLVSVVAFILSILTTYLPSRIATQVDAVKAIRFS